MAAEPRTETPHDPSTGEVRPVRPFSEFLMEHQDGDLHDEISEKLNGLVEQVQSTGRSGSVALTLTVKAAGDMVAVTADVAVKPPKVDRPVKAYFVDGNGNLTRNNPRQPELPGLRPMPRPTADEVTA